MENEELTREEIENIKKFKAIKYSRLFYPTIDQLYEKYKLQALDTNSHGKYTDEIKNALNDLRETCRCQTEGIIQLDTLLEQYEASSKFYIDHIQNRKCLSVKQNRWIFLDLLLTENAETSSDDEKVISLYNEYKKRIDNGASLDPGIILLLILRLIPTYNKSRSKDITNLKNDYNRLQDEIIDYIKDKRSEYVSDTTGKIEAFLRYKSENLFDNKDITNRLDLILKTNEILHEIKYTLSPVAFLDIIRTVQQANESYCFGLWKLKEKHNEYIWFKQIGPAILKIHYLFLNQQMHKTSEDEIMMIDKEEQQGCYRYYSIPVKTMYKLMDLVKDNTSTLSIVFDTIFDGFCEGAICQKYDNKKNIIGLELKESEKTTILENSDNMYNLHKSELEADFSNLLSEIKKMTHIKTIHEIDPLISKKEIHLDTQEGHYKLSISEASKDIPNISKLHPTDFFYDATCENENGEDEKGLIIFSLLDFLPISELLEKKYLK